MFEQSFFFVNDFAEALQRAPGVDLPATLALLLRHGAIVDWSCDARQA